MRYIGVKNFSYYIAFLTMIAMLMTIGWMHFTNKEELLGIHFFRNLYKLLVPIYLLGWLCIDKFLWKCRFLYPWFVSVPNLNGIWEGTLVSTYEKIESEKPIKCSLSIKQKLSHISCNIITGESKSESIVADFDIDQNIQRIDLIYTYRNNPKARVRYRSEIHYGTSKFSVIMEDKRVIKLEGEYWTDRKTTGEITLQKINN